MLDFQTVDPTISSAERPYKQLPRLRFNAAPRQKWLGMRFSLDSELSEFDRDSSVTGTRFDLQPRITLPLRSAAWFLEPSASLRTTFYRLSDLGSGDNDDPDDSGLDLDWINDDDIQASYLPKTGNLSKRSSTVARPRSVE